MKAGIVTSLRSQYDLKELLKSLRLPRATYYDRLKRNRKADKYAEETIRRLMSGPEGYDLLQAHVQVPFLQGQGWQSRPQYFEATV